MVTITHHFLCPVVGCHWRLFCSLSPSQWASHIYHRYICQTGSQETHEPKCCPLHRVPLPPSHSLWPPLWWGWVGVEKWKENIQIFPPRFFYASFYKYTLNTDCHDKWTKYKGKQLSLLYLNVRMIIWWLRRQKIQMSKWICIKLVKDSIRINY